MNTAQTPGATHVTRDAGERFAPSLIMLHWLIAIAVLAMLGIGLYMVGLPKGLPFKATLINFHKSLGMTVFLLVLIRIVVRMAVGRPALPPMRAWQRAAALRGNDRDAADRLSRFIVQYLRHPFLGHPVAAMGLGR